MTITPASNNSGPAFGQMTIVSSGRPVRVPMIDLRTGLLHTKKVIPEMLVPAQIAQAA